MHRAGFSIGDRKLLNSRAGILPQATVDRLTYALACLLAVLPLFTVTLPPIHDYPGHLARALVLDHLLKDGFFATLYSLNEAFVPYLASDAITLALMQVVGLKAAGIAVLLATQLVTLGGIARLSRAIHGRIQLPALLGAVFVNNWIFSFGFINYLFGIGVMLWGVAAFLDGRARSPWRQSAVIAAFAVGLYLCHIVAAVMFGLVIGCLILQELAAHKKPPGAERPSVGLAAPLPGFVLRAAPLLIPVALYAWVVSTASASPTDWGDFLQRWGESLGLGRKIKIAWGSVLSGNVSADSLSAIVITGLAAAIWLRGSARIHRLFWFPIAAAVALTFVAPGDFKGAYYIDTRLPIAALYLLLAAVSLRLPRQDVPVLRTILVGLLAVRASIFASAWTDSQRYYEDYERAFADLPAHSTLYMATPEGDYFPGYDGGGLYKRWWAPTGHVAELAIMGENEIFVPQLFADPGQQLIVRKPQFAAAAAPHLWSHRVAGNRKLERLIAGIKAAPTVPGRPVFLLIVRPAPESGAVTAQLRRRAEGSDFAIYEISD